MITLKHVNKYFFKNKKNEIHVIDDVSLELNNGLVAILGPSGCGKTTLLNSIGGLDKVYTGEIYVNNKRITRVSSGKIDEIRNLEIGYIFQDFHLINDMTVYDNVSLALKMIGIKDKNEIKKRVDYVLNILGIYKYRKRYANMLSGGERQRVAIARAIVKNPNIIIADEPTGNLDSKNTIEIMNIIKNISKDKLVILVTHERDLAEFYASRIIELSDGKVVSDKENIHDNDLDYRIDNKIYLKDLKYNETIKSDGLDLEYYSDVKNKVGLKIVYQNDNLYIKLDNNKRIELVNDDSIELVNDNYKKITTKDYEKYNFDFANIINNNFKLKYTSIYSLFGMLKDGFSKLKNYSVLKKILLIGFLLSSMFVVYSVSNIAGILDIKDNKFVTHNKNYLQIETTKIDKEKYSLYESNENINYIIPGDSDVSFKVTFDYYYQTINAIDYLNGSLSSINMINNDDLIYGRMPENPYEIVVDKLSIQKMYNNYVAMQTGVIEISDMLMKKVTLNNMKDFTIVGITDLESPSIYADESLFINILSNSASEDDIYVNYSETTSIVDYTLFDNIELKSGRLPNTYEAIVNIKNKDSYPLNKTIDLKVNNTKIKVVGYYKSDDIDLVLVNEETIKFNLLDTQKNITIYPKNKEEVISYFNDLSVNVKDIYSIDREKYISEHKDAIVSSLIVSGIILLISLVEIFLMIRSSFLSRIKEVGIKRAIGVKKSDIYKMFLGEILAINLTASLLGFVIMTYIMSGLVELPLLKDNYMLNLETSLISLLIIFGFNIIVGLVPIKFMMRKTSAQILSRIDAD